MGLDFENERYVKIYTRDTLTTKLLSWQARAVLLQMIRKADRKGLLDCGSHGVRGLAAIIDIPADVVGPAIDELAAAGTIEIVANGYVLPRYEDAQMARASTAQRKREERSRKSQSHDACHAEPEMSQVMSQIVTSNVTESQIVTGNANASREQPNVTENVTLRTEQTRTEQNRERETRANPAKSETQIVWAYAGDVHAETRQAVNPSAPNWPALVSGLGASDLRDRIRECVDREPDRSKALKICTHAVDVCAARAKATKSMQYFTPARLFDAKSFWLSAEATVEDQAKSACKKTIANDVRYGRVEPLPPSAYGVTGEQEI